MQFFLPILFALLLLNTHSSTNLKDPILPDSSRNRARGSRHGRFLGSPTRDFERNNALLLLKSFLQLNPDFDSYPDSYTKKTLASGEKIMFKENMSPCPHVFAVVDDKSNTVIAYGKLPYLITHEIDPSYDNCRTLTSEHIEIFLKAKNLKPLQSCVVSLRYILTIPFIKYLTCTSKIYYKCLGFLFQKFVEGGFCGRTYRDTYDTGGSMVPENYCFCCLFSCTIDPLSIYFKRLIDFHIKTLPFHALVLSIEVFCLEEQYISLFTHCAIRLAIFFPYSSLFPSILDQMMFLVPSFNSSYLRYKEGLSTPIVANFEIEPKNTMFAFPFLIERKRSCTFYLWILFFVIFYSLLFIPLYIIGFQKYFFQNNGEFGE